MAKIAILYGTTEGQAAKISEHIARIARDRDDEAEAMDIKDVPASFPLEESLQSRRRGRPVRGGDYPGPAHRLQKHSGGCLAPLSKTMKTSDAKSPSTNLSRKDRALLLLEREGNKRLRSLGTVLYRLTGGRFTPRDWDVLLLTTRGRTSGREHTVLLQSFRDDENMVIVAANSGRPSHPDWFHNLKATPTAQVEIMDRTLRVRAEELSDEEAAAFWPRIQLRPLPEGHRSDHPARAARPHRVGRRGIAVKTPHAETADSSWKSLYILGAAAALISVLLVLLDIFVSILLPGGEVEPGARSATDWFALYGDNTHYGFRDLGFLNMLNVVLGIPVFLALYAAHRRIERAHAALAVVLFLFGGAVYISNNAAVPMFVLSGEYAATTDAQRSILAAAGEAMLARGADFTPGSLAGFLLPSIASIAMSFVMLRGGVFGKATAYIGILGFTFLLVFTVWTTFVPGSLNVAMLIALPGGLLSMAWNVLVARRLFRLGRAS